MYTSPFRGEPGVCEFLSAICLFTIKKGDLEHIFCARFTL